jgi:hypothetical protein
MKLRIESIRAAAESRPAGYFDEVLACGHVAGDYVELDVTEYRRLAAKYTSGWPFWARALARLKTDGEAGIGDTVARLLSLVGGAAFKRWHYRRFGHPCGCHRRQAALNRCYPYAAP